MDLFSVHARHLFFQAVAFGEDQIFTQQDARRRTYRIEGLADVEAQRGIGFGANH